jgi:hypothetical protein
MKSPATWIYVTAGTAVGVLIVALTLFYGSNSPAEAPAGSQPAAEGDSPEVTEPLEMDEPVPGSEGDPGDPPDADDMDSEDGDSPFLEENQRQVVLFFHGATSELLYPELRTIVRTASVIDQAKQVVVELIAGSRQEHLPVVSAATRLRELYRIGPGTVCVDLSQDLVDNHPGGSAGELATVYSIVNSLTVNFPEIKRVRILIEGEERETLKYHVDLSREFGQDLTMVEEKFL